MAIFEYLPEQIQNVVKENLQPDEQIRMCFLAGISLFSSRDYVIITSRRVLVIDERTIGCLGRSYVNIKENVPIDQITSIEISRTFMNRLLGQSNMGLQVERYKYLIKSGNSREIKTAARLIGDLAQLTVRE